ncbi:hypothetical protein Scep_005110 [Stephania cephalantha]|uniref:Uncharacterized protein n=1 Tax=Stephania cephalantha TaxID=152367 RepID=A0AAP0KTW5_9MAGN
MSIHRGEIRIALKFTPDRCCRATMTMNSKCRKRATVDGRNHPKICKRTKC